MTLLLTFTILLIVVVAMSVGVIFANKPIKGSCGGMTAIGMDTVCDICGGDTSKCDDAQKDKISGDESSDTGLAYDASKQV